MSEVPLHMLSRPCNHIMTRSDTASVGCIPNSRLRRYVRPESDRNAAKTVTLAMAARLKIREPVRGERFAEMASDLLYIRPMPRALRWS